MNDWEFFRRVNRAQMAVTLIYLAKQVNLKKFKKSKRGEKKSKPKKKCDKNGHPSYIAKVVYTLFVST